MDDILSEKKEEDIQIDLPDGLLIIEVKGIGGTSRDDECSQISKIRSRRCEERNKFDVTALYIVNHQRHIPPLERKNPPFSEDQEKDAILDKRGLLTTWMLFKLYFNIQIGIISKEQAIKCMLKPGIISFVADKIEYISNAEETFKNGLVFIIKIGNIVLNKNDTLYQLVNDNYDVIIIESLQVDDKNVESASNCEVGIKTSKKVQKGMKIYRKIV